MDKELIEQLCLLYRIFGIDADPGSEGFVYAPDPASVCGYVNLVSRAGLAWYVWSKTTIRGGEWLPAATAETVPGVVFGVLEKS